MEQNTYAIVDEVLSQAASSQSRASSKVYMLTNVLKPPPEQQQELQSRKGPHADDDDDDEGRHGFKRKRADMLDLGTSCNLAPRFDLAMVLMGVVALQRFKVEESVMWDKFRALGLVKGRFHPIFGLPENALRDLCSQGYLHQKKSKDADNQLQVHTFFSPIRNPASGNF